MPGRTIVVTGAGTGIGRAIAAAFAADGDLAVLLGRRAKVLADAQQRFADTVDAIHAGHFPPTPDDVYRCETCTFAAVCRKDYVGDV